MKRGWIVVFSVLLVLVLTGCNGSGGGVAVVVDDASTTPGYSVEGYLGISELGSNLASARKAPLSSNIKMLFYFCNDSVISTQEVQIRDNYYSANELTTRPCTVEVYENTTLLVSIPFDTQPLSDYERGASVEYKLKMMLKKDSAGVNEIQYGFLKYMEKGSQILRRLAAATGNGSTLSESDFDFSEASKIYNINDGNRNQVRQRMKNEYQEFIISKLDSLKKKITSQIEYLLPEIDANNDTSIILNENIDIPEVEQETLIGIISDAQAVGDSLTFTRTGDANWETTVSDSYEGNSCLVSGYINDEQSTTIKSIVVGPGRLSFVWKVWSEKSDYLKFLIDDVLVDSISGKSDWQGMGYYIEDGTHEIAWTYEKDILESVGYDCGKIDSVLYESGSFVEMPTDLVASNITHSSAQITWTASTGAAGYDIYLDDTKLNTEIISSTSYDLTTLDELTRYKVVVSAIPTSTEEVEISTAPYFFTTKTSLTVKEALDIDSSDIQISYNDTKCIPQKDITSDGVDAVKITKLSSINNSPRKAVTSTSLAPDTLVLTVNGPGKLTFDWKMNEGDENNVLIAFALSDMAFLAPSSRKVVMATNLPLSTEYHMDWKTKELIIPSGLIKVYFYIASKPTSFSVSAPSNDDRFYGETAGFLDKMSFQSGDYTSSPIYYCLYEITDSSFNVSFSNGLRAPSLMRKADAPSNYYNYYLNDELYIEDTSATTITFDGLESDTVYSISASSVSNGLISPRSDKVFLKTLSSGNSIKNTLNSTNLDEYRLDGKAFMEIVEDSTASNGKAVKISKIDMDYDNRISWKFYFRDGEAYDQGIYTIRYKISSGIRAYISSSDKTIYPENNDEWLESDFYYSDSLNIDITDLETSDNAYVLIDSIVKKTEWTNSYSSYVSSLKVDDYGNGTCEVSFSFGSSKQYYKVDLNGTTLYDGINQLTDTSFELDIDNNTLYRIDVTPVNDSDEEGTTRTVFAYNETGFDEALNKGSAISWKTYGGSSWKTTTSTEATYGGKLVKNGNNGNYSTSYSDLYGTFSDTGEIKIRMKTQMNSSVDDTLYIYLDGSRIYSITSDIDWIELSKDVEEGNHTLEFRFESDVYGTDDPDTEKVLIDYVEFIKEQ